MINGLEGIPGSGKSYEAVVFHVLASVKKGRKVITNLPLKLESFGSLNPEYLDLIEIRTKPLSVRGTWDADRTPAFELYPEGEEPPAKNPLTYDGHNVAFRPKPKIFGHVWDFYSEWKGSDGQGPLFIIDECHVGMPKMGTDPQLVEWFKLHRHFNIDVLLCTQNFRQMCPDIAELMAMLIRVRKADILGRKDCYIRKVHAGFRGAVISTDERKYQPQYFPLYVSHTQGNSVAESTATDVQPFLVKFNRIKWAVIASSVVACVYAFWPQPPKEKHLTWLPAAVEDYKKNPPPWPQPPETSATPEQPSSAPEPVDLEPFRDQKIHITGWMKMGMKTLYTFAISDSSYRLFELTHAELDRSGYTFEPLGECAGVLRWGNKVRTVICNAPTIASGKNSAPVVIDSGSGETSRPI